MKKPLKVFLITEAVLFVVAILIFLMTMNSDGFEAFAILYPIYGMFLVGMAGMIYVMIHASKMPQHKTSVTYKLKKIATIFVFGLPMLYMSGFAGGGFYTQIILIILLLMSIRDFLQFIFQILIDVLLVVLPISLIVYASTLNDTNIFIFTLVLAGVFALLKFLTTSEKLINLKNLKS